MNWITAYPIATLSSAAFYLLLLSFVFPVTRAMAEPLFSHPVKPHQQYLKGFDTLRGIAAAMVALGHCWWATYPVFASTQLAAPWLGYTTKWVSIFAALSGFLIYRSGLGAVQTKASLKTYVIRRIFRIYPVYAFCVILCLILGQYSGTQHSSSTAYFFSDLFMFNALSWPRGFANPPAWSLYIEVVFYLALPLTVAAVGPRHMVLFCAIGIAAMLFADDQSRVFTLWRYFLFGIIASRLSPSLSHRAAVSCGMAGMLLLYFDFKGPQFDWAAKIGIGIKHLDEQTFALGLGAALLLAALPHLKFVGRILSFPPLQTLGVISYSVYLTQFFYIQANVPEVRLFTEFGTKPMYEHFKQMPSYSGWYLPLVFFPGALFWGAMCFLLIERPGIRFGQHLLSKDSAAKQPA